MGIVIPKKGQEIIVTEVHPSSSHFWDKALVGQRIVVRWMTEYTWGLGYVGGSFTYDNGRDGFCLGLKYEPVPPRTPTWEV